MNNPYKSILAAGIGIGTGLLLTLSTTSESISPSTSSLEQHIEQSIQQPVPVLHHYPYHDLIHTSESTYDIPHHLLAALIAGESNFNPTAKSPAGAQGLTQLMPATAEELKVTNPCDPIQSIDAGAQYLKNMHTTFAKEEGIERWKFALGAYNAGKGNIIACQNIIEAAQQGKKSITLRKQTYANLQDYASLSSDQWNDIIKVLPLVTGSSSKETIQYVEKVLGYYQIYAAPYEPNN